MTSLRAAARPLAAAAAVLLGVVGSSSFARLPPHPGPRLAAPAAVACSVDAWPLGERVEQVMLVSGEFADLHASVGQAALGVGGLVLFGSPPAGSGPAIRAGIAALDAAAARAGRVRPWMATDEEGGAVQRLADVVGALPAPRTMAETLTPGGVRARVAAVAARMAALGVDLDLAPVVDTAPADDTVADEDQRSFSDRASTVITYSRAFVAGLEAGGVTPTVKHYPGLGHANADTDLGRASDPPLARMQHLDLLPFADAAEQRVPVVMIGHPIVPGLTGGQPASMAPASYAYLRNRLGFTGVVVTDALGAGAIRDAGYSEGAAAVRAVASGADLVLVDAADAAAVRAALVTAVERGRLDEATLDRAVGLVLAAKGATPCQAPLAVGCGGATGARGPVDAVADPARPGGTWLAYADGCVVASGGAPDEGSYTGAPLPAPVVAIAATPDGGGYWLTTAAGQVLTFGNARSYGSAPPLDTPVTAIAPSPDGAGYWLLSAGGRVLGFGDAAVSGSPLERLHGALPSPAVAIAARPGGGGYWVALAGGSVEAFGDAPPLGGVVGGGGGLPVVGLVAAGRDGYWVVGEAGTVAARGDAPYRGEGSAVPTTAPTLALVPLPGGYGEVLASGAMVRFA
jgi:beta-N-acetylhexosaminidase